MREERKDQHIEYALKTEYKADSLLDQVYVEPSSFPEMSWEEVDLSMDFMGKRVKAPLMINAMTGGTELTREVNAALARLAKKFGLPMQVGSQQVALDNPAVSDSFAVVREILGDDYPILSNLSANASLKDCEEAMAMIGASGIGIHVNPSQELAMPEGDRDFRGWKEGVKALAEGLPNQVIVKQIGFGMSKEDCKFLQDLPLAYIDVSGAGGSNFMEIEDLRNLQKDFTEFYDWGVPTAQSIINAKTYAPGQKVIASGGIRTATDLIHAIILGADFGAISGELLRFLLVGSEDYAACYLDQFLEKMKLGMVLLACRNLEDLQKLPYRLVGRLRELNEES